MNGMRNLAVPAAALLLVQAACAREGDLSGDVFIVTNGGENVKLGLVEVRAIPEEVIEGHVDRKKAAARQSLASVRADYERALDARSEAESTLRAIEQSDTGNKYLAVWSINAGSQTPIAEWSGDIETAKQWQTARTRLKSANNDWYPWGERTSRWTSLEYYFTDLPAGEQVAKTDADGRFLMRLDRRRRYALAATATREVGGARETYHWLTWVSLDGKASGRVMLSNDNLADVDHPAAVLRNRDRERP
jgi:hypothetical protein